MSLVITMLIVCVQAILLSLTCVIAYVVCRAANSGYRATLLFSGLAAMGSLWILVLLPIPNLTNSLLTWIDNDDLKRTSKLFMEAPLANAPVHDFDEREPEEPTEVATATIFVVPADRAEIGSTLDSSIPQNSNINDAVVSPIGLESLQTGESKISRTSKSMTIQWLVLGLAAAVFVGMLRLIVAYGLLIHHQYKCSVLDDGQIEILLNAQASKLNIKRAVVVLESPKLRSACTTGWLRPRIILPQIWQSWTHDELASVLAHEAAHIANQDFARHLMGQFATAVHFYNPLAHWLLGRLKLELELAADQTAAVLAGGKRPYLNCLARLALAQDNATNGWLSPMFLPTGKMLICRVESLRRKPEFKPESLSPITWCLARLSTWITIAALAVLIAGLRMPVVSDSTITDPTNDSPMQDSVSSAFVDDDVPIATTTAGKRAPVVPPDIQFDESQDLPKPVSISSRVSFQFVSPQSKAILIVRPSRILKEGDSQTSNRKALGHIDESMQFLLTSANIPFGEVEQITLTTQGRKHARANDRKKLADAAIIFSSANVKRRIENVFEGKPRPLNGFEYYRLKNDKNEHSYYVCLVNAYTIVAGTETGIQSALLSRADTTFSSRFHYWSQYADSAGLLLADGEFMKRNNRGADQPNLVPKTFLAAFNLGPDQHRVNIVLNCNSARAARTQRALYNGMKTPILRGINEVKNREDLRSDPDWDDFMLLGELLESMKCSIADKVFSASFEFDHKLKWDSSISKVTDLLFSESPGTKAATDLPLKDGYEKLADHNIVAQYLAVHPRRRCDIDHPVLDESLAVFKYTSSGETNWILRDKYGRLYRKFIDSNADRQIDKWVYYKNGVEVYRDVDSDFDRVADLHILAADIIQVFAEVDGIVSIKTELGNVVVNGQELARIHTHIPMVDVTRQYDQISKKTDRLLDQRPGKNSPEFAAFEKKLKYFRQQEKSLINQLRALNEQKEKTFVRSPANARMINWNVSNGDSVQIGQLLGTVLKLRSDSGSGR